MGPELASKCVADGLAWAQHWSQHLLLKALYGPSTGPKICYRLSCMGLALPPKYGADGLVWAQHWLQNMMPIILYGPRTGLKLCYRWSHMGPLLVPHVLPMVLHGPSTGSNPWHCMGPALVTKYTADHLVWAQSWPQPIVAWAQHWSQNMLPIVLYGPSTAPKIWC